jgi:hypothetical protein
MIDDNDDAPRLTPQGITAMCIGGMIVTRTIVDRALADELRASCMAVAHDLAGWKLHPNSNLKKFRRGRKTRRTARPWKRARVSWPFFAGNIRQ